MFINLDNKTCTSLFTAVETAIPQGPLGGKKERVWAAAPKKFEQRPSRMSESDIFRWLMLAYIRAMCGVC